MCYLGFLDFDVCVNFGDFVGVLGDWFYCEFVVCDVGKCGGDVVWGNCYFEEFVVEFFVGNVVVILYRCILFYVICYNGC